MKCQFKVSIIGCGSVGAAGAYAMLLDGTPTDLTLIDLDADLARGVRTDFEHALSFNEFTKLEASGEIEACAGSNLVFVTAGARQKEGQTRLELIEVNRKIFSDIIPRIAKAAPNAIIVIVTNPVDILTHEAIKLANLPDGRVFGTGTMLDTARFQYHIGEALEVSPRSVEAYVLGEHGDSSFPVFSSAQIGGKHILNFENFGEAGLQKAYEVTREAAYRIIHDMGYTCYSIGVVMREIMKHVFENSRIVLPLSTLLNDYYGHSDVCLSVPCILGENGIESTIKIPLNEEEQQKLAHSVKVVKGVN